MPTKALNLTGSFPGIRRKKVWKGPEASPAGTSFCAAARGSPTDYRRYRLSLWEWLCLGGTGGILAGLLAYTFYRSMGAFLLLLPAGIIGYPLYRRRELLKKRQWKLTLEFREAIGLLSSFLSAGYSVENAFAASLRELRSLYGDRAMITEEFGRITAQLRMNRPIEALLEDFALRSGVDEIRNFTEVFSIARRSGGELCTIIEHTVSVIRETLSVGEEIETLTAARRFEQRIMNLMPFGIILYIDLSSGGFFEVMYSTAAGRLIMTVCLLVYLAACLLSERIMDIRL